MGHFKMYYFIVLYMPLQILKTLLIILVYYGFMVCNEMLY